jgi:hypothetical protein
VYAPQYAPRRAELTEQAEHRRSPLIPCPVTDLRQHPSYIRHRLSVDASKLSALAERGDLAFCDPIAITRDRIVIDGYARWELAKRVGREVLDCIEYDLSSEEALGELLRTHRPSGGLTDFLRIELALDLESYFQGKALINQQVGGKDKGASKLTIAQRVNTRREIARVASVSAGNVRKVKQILTHACSPLLQAARIEEVSINLAEKWSHEPERQQQEHLRLFRLERGLKRKARHLVASHLARMSPPALDRRVMKLSDLVGLLNQLDSSTEIDVASIEVRLVDAPGRMVFVTEELIGSLAPAQGILLR